MKVSFPLSFLVLEEEKGEKKKGKKERKKKKRRRRKRISDFALKQNKSFLPRYIVSPKIDFWEDFWENFRKKEAKNEEKTYSKMDRINIFSAFDFGLSSKFD